MNRINWIDWAKCIAVTTVVFCHLPQSQEWMYFRYLQTTIITVFFFLSGYLKRDRGTMRDNWHKYWYGLVVPYVVYNLISLPYWVLRYYLKVGMLPDLTALSKPVIGALLLEHSSSFAEPLNGALWYLPAVLAMHLITDFCHRTRHEHLLMTTLCLASCVVYYVYRTHGSHPDLTPTGFIRRLPFFYIGYVMGRGTWIKSRESRYDAIRCVAYMALSIILFYWHVAVFDQFVLHIALFYPVNLCFLLGVIYGCKLLNGSAPRWVLHISIGTLVVIGLHWIAIGIVNFVMSRWTSFSVATGYTWYEAIPVTLLVMLMHYPIIVWAIRHAPLLRGRENHFLTRLSSASS